MVGREACNADPPLSPTGPSPTNIQSGTEERRVPVLTQSSVMSLCDGFEIELVAISSKLQAPILCSVQLSITCFDRFLVIYIAI